MLKIALIGAGFIGAAHAAACTNSKLLDLKAICDLNEKVGKELAEKHGCSFFTDAEKMLQECDIDIVLICLPTYLHKQYILLATKYKKHVICEKPITLSMEDMDEILDAVKAAGVKFMVAQVLRFWPEYVAIKEMYDNGDFGEVKMVYANRLAQHPNWTEWHKDPKNSGGGLFDLHLHDIDVIIHFFGPVDRVYAVSWKTPAGCYNHVATTLSFKNGARAIIEGAYNMTENYPFTMAFRIVGEAKTAEYTMVAGFNLEDVSSSTRDLFVFKDGGSPVRAEIDESVDAYQAELDYFADCVANDKPLKIITPEDSREVLRVMLAIQESIETGRTVEL